MTSAVTRIAFFRQWWEGLKELEEVFAVRYVRGDYFYKRLYEVCDIICKLVGGAITR